MMQPLVYLLVIDSVNTFYTRRYDFPCFMINNLQAVIVDKAKVELLRMKAHTAVIECVAEIVRRSIIRALWQIYQIILIAHHPGRSWHRNQFVCVERA